MMYKLLKKYTCLALLLSVCAVPQAIAGQLVVIAHPDTRIEGISMTELHNIYMGISKTFNDGTRAVPVHQAKGQAARQQFFTKVLKKTENQMNRYWSRRKFSGKGNPPDTLADSKAVQKWVMSTPGGLGYIEDRYLGRGVKVLLIIP